MNLENNQLSILSMEALFYNCSALSGVQNVIILDQLGLVYGQTGRTQAAVKIYQDILVHSPNNTDVLMHYVGIISVVFIKGIFMLIYI